MFCRMMHPASAHLLCIDESGRIVIRLRTVGKWAPDRYNLTSRNFSKMKLAAGVSYVTPSSMYGPSPDIHDKATGKRANGLILLEAAKVGDILCEYNGEWVEKWNLGGTVDDSHIK